VRQARRRKSSSAGQHTQRCTCHAVERIGTAAWTDSASKQLRPQWCFCTVCSTCLLSVQSIYRAPFVPRCGFVHGGCCAVLSSRGGCGLYNPPQTPAPHRSPRSSSASCAAARAPRSTARATPTRSWSSRARAGCARA